MRIDGTGQTREADDSVAIEEPLEIQVRSPGREYVSVSVTMRTPGHDAELATGFLFNEGIVDSATDILAIEHWGPLSTEEKVHNIVRIDIARPTSNLGRMERHFLTSASCGVCGKASLASVRMQPTSLTGESVAADLIRSLPHALREHQLAFAQTGGMHATAIFDSSGSLRYLFEDVGRHNALDKAAGALLFENGTPARHAIILVSGRVGFELVQKTIRMGCPILCAIGAPSSLAIELARAASLTLIAFLRDDRFNVYSGADRLRTAHTS